MISQGTVERIWKCQREIIVGGELLSIVEKQVEEMKRDGKAERIRDAFGRERNLTLGIPSGENGHKLLDVSPVLAISIIRAHIANKEAELVTANEQARIELG